MQRFNHQEFLGLHHPYSPLLSVEEDAMINHAHHQDMSTQSKCHNICSILSTTEGYKDDPLHRIQCIIAVTMGSLFLKADDPPSDDLKLKFKLGPILISQSLCPPYTDSLAGTFQMKSR